MPACWCHDDRCDAGMRGVLHKFHMINGSGKTETFHNSVILNAGKLVGPQESVIFTGYTREREREREGKI